MSRVAPKKPGAQGYRDEQSLPDEAPPITYYIGPNGEQQRGYYLQRRPQAVHEAISQLEQQHQARLLQARMAQDLVGSHPRLPDVDYRVPLMPLAHQVHQPSGTYGGPGDLRTARETVKMMPLPNARPGSYRGFTQLPEKTATDRNVLSPDSMMFRRGNSVEADGFQEAQANHPSRQLRLLEQEHRATPAKEIAPLYPDTQCPASDLQCSCPTCVEVMNADEAITAVNHQS